MKLSQNFKKLHPKAGPQMKGFCRLADIRLPYSVPVLISVEPGFRFKFLLVFLSNKAVERTLFSCLSVLMDYALRVA